MSDRKNKDLWHTLWKSYFKLDEYAVMFLYGGTLVGLTILYSLIVNPSLTPEIYTEMEAEQTLNTIIRRQQEYFRDNRLFTRQLGNLEMNTEIESYSYRILFPSQPVQTTLSLTSELQDLSTIATIAHPLYKNLSVYLGIVQMAGDSTTAVLKPKLNVCRSKSTLGVLKSQRNVDFSLSNFTNSHQTDTRFSCPIDFENLEK
ncbi:MAG: hypothetical protein J7647_25980 [Cyanobacteria bacterium SBLK]|nr:hypothetical protein [Cyanobacteria bacterium SBLK]